MWVPISKHRLKQISILMVLLFTVASLATPLINVGRASALTPQQLQDCYFYNGKRPTEVVTATSSGNTTAPNYGWQECVDMGACIKPAVVTDILSCSNPTQQAAVDIKLGSAITTICGPNNAIGAAYNSCVTDVTDAYNKCKNAPASSATADGTKEQAIAACLAGKFTGVNPAKLATALTASAASTSSLYGSEQACKAANGQWDAAAQKCTGAEETSPPTCELSGNPLSWIICPIITGLIAGVDAIRSLLQGLLMVHIKPVGANGDEAAYKDIYSVWSNVRIIGNLMLLIALIVIVFTEVTGGGALEAYTVKKVLPRLLIGAVMINLSFYIIMIVNDIMNVIGVGIYSLMTSPLTGGGLHRVNVDATLSILGTAGLGGVATAIFTAGGLVAAAGMWLLVFVLLPAMLIVLAGLVIIILRQGLIIVLLVLSPIAFALYCLPNTEKYFRNWWEQLFKAFLVFPIVMALFGASTMLSTLLGAAELGDATPFKGIVQLIVALAPIALVAFAFKLAGGLLGNLMESGRALSKRTHQGILGSEHNPYSMRNKAKWGLSREGAAYRSREYEKGLRGGFRGIRGNLRRAAGMGNLEATMARHAEERQKIMEQQSGNGNDRNQRDMFIAQAGPNGSWYRRMDLERNQQGQLVPAAGAEPVYKDARTGQIAHKKAMSLHRGSTADVQQGLYYEWKKTGFDEGKLDRIKSQYGEILDEHGFNREDEAGGIYANVKFRHQQQSLFQKYESYGKLGDGTYGWKTDRIGHASETARMIGLYGASNQDEKSFNEMGVTYQQTGNVIDNVMLNKSSSDDYVIQEDDVVSTLMSTGVSKPDIKTSDYGQYVGKTLGQVKNAHRQIAATAEQVDPRQVSVQQTLPPAAGSNQPQQQSIGRGISNAPVDVQVAAENFARIVENDRSARARRNITTPQPPRDDSGYIPRG